MKKGNMPYSLFVLIILAALMIGSFVWMKYKESLFQTYVEENGLTLLTEQELEDIKDQAYDEGYEDGKSEGYDEGYEEGAEDFDNGSGVTIPTVYYTDNGDCYHMNPSCTSIRYNSKIHECKLNELQYDLRPCDICVPHSDL